MAGDTGSLEHKGRMGLEDLPGRSVLDSSGRVLGTVQRALIDTESWAVESLRVRLRPEAAAELGMASSMFHSACIDVPTGLIFAASDAVILRATLADLQGLAPSSQSPPMEATAH